MSFADTYSAATPSIVVSPWTTGTSCIGPQLVGLIVPEKVPLATALAEPANIVIMKPATARAAMIRPARKLTGSSPASVPRARRARKSAGNIPRFTLNPTFYIFEPQIAFWLES